jgi:hypothetical protein
MAVEPALEADERRVITRDAAEGDKEDVVLIGVGHAP